MKRRAGAVVVVATSLALASPSWGAPQHWSPIGLSRDGHTWSSRLDQPLFTRTRTLVPGEAPVRTFYVRNQSHDRARLTLGVRVTDRTGALRWHGFRLAVRTRSGHWHRIRSERRARVRQLVVRPGGVVPVSVRVRLLPWAGNRTMAERLSFTLHLRLTQHPKGVH